MWKSTVRDILRGRSRGSAILCKVRPCLELLEARELLAVVSVNAAESVRAVDTQLLGVNVAWWDCDLNTNETQQMVQAAGPDHVPVPRRIEFGRFSLQRSADLQRRGDRREHGQLHRLGGWRQGWSRSITDRAARRRPRRSSPIWTRPSATRPRSAAARSGTTRRIRGRGQLADGRLLGQPPRLGAAGDRRRAQLPPPRPPRPFAFQYCEVGNEEYGSWEIDHHGSGGDTARPRPGHVHRVRQAVRRPTPRRSTRRSRSGSTSASPGGSENAVNNWTAEILQQSAEQGFMPGFLSDHNYVQSPGSESDSNLLLDTVTDTSSDPSDPGNPYDWAVRAADYREPAHSSTSALPARTCSCWRPSSTRSTTNPGKQTTSLVNGLFAGRLARRPARNPLRRRRCLGPARMAM